MLSKKKTVLLIDDNEVDLKINSKIIEISKLFEEIVLCHSAEAGLTYIHQNLSNESLLPDFILLDIQMPDMDGFDFLERYKKLPVQFTDKCLIAILSSTLDFGDIQRAQANPFVIKLLKKPLFPKELKDLLVQYSI
jgi:CheY-like chemotaxis protein